MATTSADIRCPGCGAHIEVRATVPLDSDRDRCRGCAEGLTLCTDYTAAGVRRYHMTQGGVSVPHRE